MLLSFQYWVLKRLYDYDINFIFLAFHVLIFVVLSAFHRSYDDNSCTAVEKLVMRKLRGWENE